MRLTRKCATIGAIIAAGAAVTTAAIAAPPKPKISARRARSIAAHKIHGKVISAKYEFEDGHWQYGVLVTRGKALYEVEINSTTGKVLDTERTSMAEERTEAAEDQKMAGKTGKNGSHATAESGEKGEKGEAGEAPEKH